MYNPHLKRLCAILLLTASSSAFATILEDWQFENATNGDDINTGDATTGASTNSANASGATWTNNAWVSDVYDGRLLVGGRIGSDAAWNNFSPDISTGIAYLVIENVDWQLEGGSTGETIRFGLSTTGNQTGATGLALERTAGTTVTLSGFSDNGTAVAGTTTFSGSAATIGSFDYDNISDDSYDFVICFDYDNDTYEVFYKTTSQGEYTSLGSGTMLNTDVASSVAIIVNGNAASFDNGDVITNEEHFSIDRIYIADDFTFPQVTDIFDDFTFEADLLNDSITLADNSGTPGNASWSQNAMVSNTDGAGNLYVGGRNNGTPGSEQSHADIDDVSTGIFYLGVEGVTWRLEGGTQNETIQLGFGSQSDNHTNTTGIQLSRTGGDVVLSDYSATGTASGNTAILPSSADGAVDDIADEPWDFIVEFDFDSDEYELFYKTSAASAYESLGTGTLQPTDNASSIAINIVGNLTSLGSTSPDQLIDLTHEHFLIDRIYTADDLIVPIIVNIYADFPFDDGTNITNTSNVGSESNQWNNDIGEGTGVSGGNLTVGDLSPNTSGNQSFVTISDTSFNQADGGVRYLVLEGVDIDFEGGGFGNDRYGIGLTQGSSTGGNNEIAAIWILRDGSDAQDVFLQGYSEGDGTTTALSLISDETVVNEGDDTSSNFDIYMCLDFDNDTYEIFWRTAGGGSYTSIGSATLNFGKLANGTAGRSVYFDLNGLNSGGENIQFDRILFTDTDPSTVTSFPLPAPAVDPGIVTFSITGTTLNFTITGAPNTTYVLKSTDDLASSPFPTTETTSPATVTTDGAGDASFTATTDFGSSPIRFYGLE